MDSRHRIGRAFLVPALIGTACFTFEIRSSRAVSPASEPAAVSTGPAETQPAEDPDAASLRVIQANPANPMVADIVYPRRDRFGAGEDRFAQKVKAQLRKALETVNDPQVAWSLAGVIQDQLAGTSLQWSNRAAGSYRSLRGDPAESFETLAGVLEIGFNRSRAGDAWHSRFATSLAKVRLLQGDWDGMNAWLRRIGDEPVPAEERPFLTAPPADWSRGPRKEWRPCDQAWRTGECSLAFRFEKDGRGLAGVHVLVREQPPKSNVFMSGIETDTLFLADTPMAWDSGFRMQGFGYLAGNRNVTRYGVSGLDGRVLFQRLPTKEVRIEVLVPTANFREPGRAWDLFMETEPGKFQIAQVYGEERVDPDSDLATPELNPGQVAEYPRMVVRPQIHLPLEAYTQADRRSFVLHWEDPGGASPDGKYEVELKLIGPPREPMFAEYEEGIETCRQTVSGRQWPLGEKGVGGMSLIPGSLYRVRVLARDKEGQLVARSRYRVLWVPWGHRESEPPSREHGGERQSPIQTKTWYRGTFRYGMGPETTLQTRVDRFLHDYPNAFEREYVQVGKAFLDWHDGKLEEANAELEQLVKELPKGTVPQATAAWLLALDEDGESLPKSLDLKTPTSASCPEE